MSKLHDLIEKGPALCGVKNPERWSEMFLHVFNVEISDKLSAFASQDSESIEDRLDVINGLYNAKGAQFIKVAFWIGLLQLCAYSYAVSKGHDELTLGRDRLMDFLAGQEVDNQEIASVMSVQEAGTLTAWN